MEIKVIDLGGGLGSKAKPKGQQNFLSLMGDAVEFLQGHFDTSKVDLMLEWGKAILDPFIC